MIKLQKIGALLGAALLALLWLPFVGAALGAQLSIKELGMVFLVSLIYQIAIFVLYSDNEYIPRVFLRLNIGMFFLTVAASLVGLLLHAETSIHLVFLLATAMTLVPLFHPYYFGDFQHKISAILTEFFLPMWFIGVGLFFYIIFTILIANGFAFFDIQVITGVIAVSVIYLMTLTIFAFASPRDARFLLGILLPSTQITAGFSFFISSFAAFVIGKPYAFYGFSIVIAFLGWLYIIRLIARRFK